MEYNHKGFSSPVTGLTVILLISNGESVGVVNRDRFRHGLSGDAKKHDLPGNRLSLDNCVIWKRAG